MKSYSSKSWINSYPYETHQFNVGDDVYVLAPVDGSDDNKPYDGDYEYYLGKLLKLYKDGKYVWGDVKAYKFNKVYKGEVGVDIHPDFLMENPKEFVVRFKYSHRTNDEQEFTARSKEEAKDKFKEWASDMECSEDFDFQFIDAEEGQQT